jgi:hypothetical protein
MKPEKTTISLFDLRGRMILTADAAEQQTTLEVGHLSSGVYVLVASDTKQTRHARVVISR